MAACFCFDIFLYTFIVLYVGSMLGLYCIYKFKYIQSNDVDPDIFLGLTVLCFVFVLCFLCLKEYIDDKQTESPKVHFITTLRPTSYKRQNDEPAV